MGDLEDKMILTKNDITMWALEVNGYSHMILAEDELNSIWFPVYKLIDESVNRIKETIEAHPNTKSRFIICLDPFLVERDVCKVWNMLEKEFYEQ